MQATIAKVADSFGFKLKLEQERSLQKFIAGNDIFISLPTGYGKSLCYILLPPIFDIIRKVDKKSIVLVVSPLIALMKDQVATVTAMGLSSTYVTDKQSTTSSVKAGIKNGDYQIIFVSPEALFFVYRVAKYPFFRYLHIKFDSICHRRSSLRQKMVS